MRFAAAVVFAAMVATAPGVRAEQSWRSALARAEISTEDFTRAAAEAAREVAGGAEVVISEPLGLEVREEEGRTYEIYLGNLYRSLPDEWDARADEVERFLRAALTAQSESALERSQLRPVLRSRQFCDFIATRWGSKQSLLRQSFAGDIELLFVADRGRGLHFLSREEVATLGIPEADLRRVATETLVAALEPPTRHAVGRVTMVGAGGTFESSLLLDERFWTDAESDAGGPITAAIPARDLLLYARSDDPEAIDQLALLAKKYAEESGYGISALLLERTAHGWRVSDRSGAAR